MKKKKVKKRIKVAPPSKRHESKKDYKRKSLKETWDDDRGIGSYILGEKE